jgi:ABC-type multidrug transport system ATPase subunit
MRAPNLASTRDIAATLLPEGMDTLHSVAAGPILEVDDLARSFDNHDVVKALSLVVEPGERVALFGPNGAGKTTFLRCVAGTLSPTRGRIEIGGHKAGTMPARLRTGVAVAQERSWYQRLSGRANLVFFAQIRTGSKRSATREVNAIVEELELDEIAAQRVDRCSTGMVQQLSFARALLCNPSLVLLDEPTRSLDREARKRVWQALDRRTQSAVLLATHLDEDLEHCGSRVEFPT